MTLVPHDQEVAFWAEVQAIVKAAGLTYRKGTVYQQTEGRFKPDLESIDPGSVRISWRLEVVTVEEGAINTWGTDGPEILARLRNYFVLLPNKPPKRLT